MAFRTTEEVQNQTHEEWWADNDGIELAKIPSVPVSNNLKLNDSEHLFHYVDHKTTSKIGGLVLTFESLDKSFEAVLFFNVKLKSNRGTNYPARKRGEFFPPERGKFRKFWMDSTGIKPERWCRVHKSMRSKLQSLVFIGITKQEIDKKGNSYMKITDIRKR